MVNGVYTRCDSSSCTNGGYNWHLHSGWELVPESADIAQNVITDPNDHTFHHWGTGGLVFSNGNYYNTKTGAFALGGELTGNCATLCGVAGGVQGAILMRIAVANVVAQV